MKAGYEIFDSQRFKSARGNASLIDLAKITVRYDDGDQASYVVRVSIEAQNFATIEAWSVYALSWNELHTIPKPLMPDSVDEALEALMKAALQIVGQG